MTDEIKMHTDIYQRFGLIKQSVHWRILDDELVGKYEIFDTTSLLLSNNPSNEFIGYLEKITIL